MLPFSTLLTSDDGRTVADDIWQEIIVSHPYKQSECLVPLPTFLTSPDGRIVAEDVQQQIMVSHPYKHSKCMVPLPTLLTSVVTRIVDDDVRQNNNCVASLQTVRVRDAIVHFSQKRRYQNYS